MRVGGWRMHTSFRSSRSASHTPGTSDLSCKSTSMVMVSRMQRASAAAAGADSRRFQHVSTAIESIGWPSGSERRDTKEGKSSEQARMALAPSAWRERARRRRIAAISGRSHVGGAPRCDPPRLLLPIAPPSAVVARVTARRMAGTAPAAMTILSTFSVSMRGPIVIASRAMASAVEVGGGGGTARARHISSAPAATAGGALFASSEA